MGEVQLLMVQKLLSFVEQDSELLPQWKVAFVAGLVALFPLLLTIDLYIDDIGRAMHGNRGWVRVGRPFADLLVELLNFGRPATAIAPLHALLAIALLSFVGVICARIYGVRSPFWVAMASLPLMAQPYALQAMSYGFDSLFMATALAFSIISAILIHLQKSWKVILLSLVLQLVSFGLYQPAANAFLAMSGCLCIGSSLGLLDRSWSVLSQRWRWLVSAIVYSGGYGAYRLLFALFFEQRLNGYASSAARLKPFDGELGTKIVLSAFEQFYVLGRDFSYLPVLLPFLCLFLAYFVLLVRSRPLSLVFKSLAAMFLILLLAPGGMLLLKDSFVRHPRVLIYFGPLLTNLFLQVFALSSGLRQRFWRFTVLPLVWLMVAFSYSYGNAFAAQARFEQSRLSRIVSAVSVLQFKSSRQPVEYLMVKGAMPRSPILQNTIRKFPLIDRLIPPLLQGSQTFSYQQLKLHGLTLKKRNLDGLEDSLPSTCQNSQTSICTSEFSLQFYSPDTLYLELASNPSSARPST